LTRGPASPSGTAPVRSFVPLATPFLAEVARRLAAENPTRGDFSDDLVVVPGTQAGRDLAAHLSADATDATDATGVEGALQPVFLPAIVTAGDLPRLLVPQDPPMATPLEWRLAIAAVLRELPRGAGELLSPRGVALRDEASRFVLAGELSRVFREIGSFERTAHEVREAAETLSLDGYTGARRWAVLVEIEARSIEVLARSGRAHETTALRQARSRGPSAFHRPRRVSLVGMADLAPAMVGLLGALAVPISVFIQGDGESSLRRGDPEPEEEGPHQHQHQNHEGRFDDWGVVVPARWELAPLPLADARLSFVSGPREQGDVVARILSDFLENRRRSGAPGSGRVLVGSTDAADEPMLVARAAAASPAVTLRSARGRPANRSLAATALGAARDLLVAESVEALSAFVRHPYIEPLVWKQGEKPPAAILDAKLSRSPARAPMAAARAAEPALSRAVDEVLRPLLQMQADRDAGGEHVVEFLRKITANVPFSPRERRATTAVIEAARSLAVAPPGLRPRGKMRERLQLVLDAVQDEVVAQEEAPEAIDVVGFLELPLAEADLLIVTGVGEGRLPQTGGDDPLLPEALRRAARLSDRARTFARDAHALLVIAGQGGHREAHIVAPKVTATGDALLVSRLLLADRAEVAARRLRAQYGHDDGANAGQALPPRSRAGATVSRFAAPPALPTNVARPTVLSVTAFRDYLACPYRFALRHIYRLNVAETDPAEFSPAAFGHLLHAALADFGTSEVKDVDDPRLIAEFCLERLAFHLAATTFGAPTAAAEIQAEQAKARLRSFAEVQARHRADGYRIAKVEAQTDTDEALRRMTVRGRIDRIDVHEDGRVLLLDYKTHDRISKPESSHQKRGEWVDLQLPLYRHLAKEMGFSAGDRGFLLGYASLPRDRAAFTLASWSEEELRAADGVAQTIVDKVLDEPLPTAPVSPPPRYSETFAGICRDGSLTDDEEEDEDEEAG
jgi:ATP-dependent helicase/nuclease subunit B